MLAARVRPRIIGWALVVLPRKRRERKSPAEAGLLFPGVYLPGF